MGCAAPILGVRSTEDMGFLKDVYDMTMFEKTPEGTCPVCGVKHIPEMPHNRHSLTYQFKFYDKHGRFPTWEDAMAHCSDEVKTYWVQELKEKGEWRS